MQSTLRPDSRPTPPPQCASGRRSSTRATAPFIISTARSIGSSAAAASNSFTAGAPATAPGNWNRASWPNPALSSAFAISRSTAWKSFVQENPSRPRWITRRPTPLDELPETDLSWLSWNRTPALSASS